MAVSYTHLDVYKRQGRQRGVHALHNIVRHQHRVRPGLNAGTERHKVRLLKCFIAACIARNACVRCLLYTSRCV